jgi:hypothetical protein
MPRRRLRCHRLGHQWHTDTFRGADVCLRCGKREPAGGKLPRRFDTPDR